VNILVHERVHNVDTLPKLLVVDNPVEPLEPESLRLTLDSATEFLFGKSCDSQISATQREAGQASDDTRIGMARNAL
jgi:hypothetical protein